MRMHPLRELACRWSRARARFASAPRRLRRAALAAALLPCAAGGAAAQDLPPRYLLNPAQSQVWFEAGATLGRFRGTAHDVVGWAQLADTVTFRDTRGRVELMVASFRTGNTLRDRHLRATMQVERYPRIIFVLDEVVRPPGPPRPGPGDAHAADGGRPVILHGALIIRDTTRAVEIPARAQLDGETLRVRGELPIRLTDYGIDPPSRLLGTARMRNELELHFDAVFEAVAG